MTTKTHRFPIPMGLLSARVHGARNQLRGLATSAGRAARATASPEAAAALRGKRAAYLEAERIVAAVERGWRLPRYIHGRRCTCSPQDLELGGYERGCPVHDNPEEQTR